MKSTLSIFNRLKGFPFGKAFFAYLVCRRLPYFGSIRPQIVELAPGRSVVQMSDRRSVHNHLGTVHAIAQCNLCELAMAMVTEATIPQTLRYIPIGMKVSYRKKACGTLRAIAQMSADAYCVGSVDVPVEVYDPSDSNVMSAVITLDVKEKSAPRP